ncbi:hypothetical protein [Streptomyces avermitilis]|uniref:hypothetical protein n=1 Tax=Streptomyces avermitilis TaxID=33903 RepID=UPI0037F9A712
MVQIVELGERLRSCHVRLAPAEAGRARTSRRPVPGLCREAPGRPTGLSVDRCTAPGQGRSGTAPPAGLQTMTPMTPALSATVDRAGGLNPTGSAAESASATAAAFAELRSRAGRGACVPTEQGEPGRAFSGT